MFYKLLKSLAIVVAICTTTDTWAQCPKVTDISIIPTSATSSNINWQVVPDAHQYEYAVLMTNTTPTMGTLTAATGLTATGLAPNSKYYFCVRSICTGGSSDWQCNSFNTPDPASVHNVNGQGIFAISVYPNPTSGLVNVKLLANYPSIGTITTYNIIGNKISAKRVTSTNMSVDLSNYAPGIYLVKYADEFYTKTIKVYKQ